LNTDATVYGGTGMGNMGQAQASAVILSISPPTTPTQDTQPKSVVDSIADSIPTDTAEPATVETEIQLTVCLPPLATLIFEWSGQEDTEYRQSSAARHSI
jgi:Na+-translocating ferredoxin:NAD+ oxidoreductase RnfD subunit